MWINHAKYVDLVRDSNTAYWLSKKVDELGAAIVELKVSLAAERKRADNAVDRLLNVNHLPAVTPPDKVTLDELSGMFEETPEGIAAIKKAIEEQGIEEVLLTEAR